MPLLNCGRSQFSTMPELHFADTRSIVPSEIRLNQCHPFRLSSWYLYIPTFDGTLDTTFEVKRTSVPAGFTRAWRVDHPYLVRFCGFTIGALTRGRYHSSGLIRGSVQSLRMA